MRGEIPIGRPGSIVYGLDTVAPDAKIGHMNGNAYFAYYYFFTGPQLTGCGEERLRAH